jgi:hypothetical protein
MLTLILATAIATQTYENDFYFMMATEDFVIDSAPKPVRYSQFLPKELCEQVDLWDTDCWRCRRRANEAVVRMGPSVVRWLFYPLRAKSPSVKLHAEAVINKLISCRFCGGRGICQKYIPAKGSLEACETCHAGKNWHDLIDNTCIHCNGGPFEVDTRPYNYGGYEFQ